MASHNDHRSLFFLLYVLISLHLGICQHSVADTLELVQLIYRHGDRSPTDPFPNDINNPYWTDGFGQLTNLGKQQQFSLGHYIRQRYSGFLNESYNFEEVLINSTDVDRTLMSCYCNLAGIFPPVGDEVWNKDIMWQPIPVHTIPAEIDYIVNAIAYCPKYDQIFNAAKASPEMQQINTENAELYDYVTNQTNYDVHDIFTLSNVYDALFCDKCHNLTLPDWANPLWDTMEYFSNLKMYYEWGLPQIARLIGGPMLGHMIDNMNLKINGELDKMQAFIFSSHDSKVTSLLAAMDIWNGLMPPYASTVFVELHRMPDGGHGVQILYYNDTTVEPFTLTLPDCSSPCPIDDFISLTSDMIPEDIVKECILIPEISQSLWQWTASWFK